jgi:hypothetical protein
VPDIGNKRAIGGLSRSFYERIAAHYSKESAWVHEKREDRIRTNEPAQWVFEPHAAELIFRAMLAETRIRILFGERLDRKGGLEKDQSRIRAIRMESGRTVRANVHRCDVRRISSARRRVLSCRSQAKDLRWTLNGVQTKRHLPSVRKVSRSVSQAGDPQRTPSRNSWRAPADGSSDNGAGLLLSNVHHRRT